LPATVVETASDTFNLFTHYYDPSPPNLTQISGFPITVMSNYSSSQTPWFGPAGLVGLGPSSTLLQHLYNLKLIASRSFGLYMGTAYVESNGVSNGSLTLGGYDSGRFVGDVYNFSMANAAPTPFKVSVSQMTLISGGSKTPLLAAPFDAYITTSQYQLDLPAAVTRQFESVTKATPADNVLQLPADFDGSLTISLVGGLSVTYDGQWLRNVSNNSPISTTDSTASTNLLGSAFLSSLYLMANYDSHPPSFQLASALPNAPYVQTMTLCADTAPTAAAPTEIPNFSRAGLTGAIIGGVVGGMGLTVVVWFFVRRWMQKRRQQKPHKEVTTISVRGKGSPSDSDSDKYVEDGRDGREMATFAFDFNSHQHQSYQQYLQSRQQYLQSQQRVGGNDTKDAVVRAQEYFRSLDDAYVDTNPLTPATGRPLLDAAAGSAGFAPGPGAADQSSLRSHLSHHVKSQAASVSGPNLQPPTHPRRTSNESARRQDLGLNIQTEFAPPPKSAQASKPVVTATTNKSTAKSATASGGGKKSMLKKVFPPPGS
jgi:hypothetical protein